MSASGAAASTANQHLKAYCWKPGQSGNPAGRQRGSRNKLGEALIETLASDFAIHGPKAVELMRREKPAEYVKVIASLLPKQVEIKEDAFEGVTDEQLAAIVAAARASLGIIEGSYTAADTTSGTQSPGELQAVPETA